LREAPGSTGAPQAGQAFQSGSMGLPQAGQVVFKPLPHPGQAPAAGAAGAVPPFSARRRIGVLLLKMAIDLPLFELVMMTS